MDFLIILIDLVVIALGIVDVRFGFICRREQHQNKMNAQIYVGDGKIVWIFGLISWVAGILEMILLLHLTIVIHSSQSIINLAGREHKTIFLTV